MNEMLRCKPTVLFYTPPIKALATPSGRKDPQVGKQWIKNPFSRALRIISSLADKLDGENVKQK